MGDTARVAVLSALVMSLAWGLVGRDRVLQPAEAEPLSQVEEAHASATERARREVQAYGVDEKYLSLYRGYLEDLDQWNAQMPYERFELEDEVSGYVQEYERVSFELDGHARLEGRGDVARTGTYFGRIDEGGFAGLCLLAEYFALSSMPSTFPGGGLHQRRTQLRLWRRGQPEPETIFIRGRWAGPPELLAFHGYLRHLADDVAWEATDADIWNWSHPRSGDIQALFWATPRSGEAPLSVEFWEVSVGDVDEFRWNFDDPTSSSPTSNLANPSHFFRTPGTYDITLEVAGSDGRSTTTERGYITVTE